MNPLHAIDSYKLDHRSQYPEGTTMVYSNFTARSDRHKTVPDFMWSGKTVFFGLQYYIRKFLIEDWNTNFFNLPLETVMSRYIRRVANMIGSKAITYEHIEKLHNLGYLPIEIKALPEGSLVPIRVPMLVIYNTHPDFFWLTNYLETSLSSYLWKSITSATTAYHCRKFYNEMAVATGADPYFCQFQGHDFSARGMSGMEDSSLSGAAHLLSFSGTDTVCAIDLLEDYYGANSDKELVGVSVAATEHSTMQLNGNENEFETYKRLITKVYPSGIVSIVSDTWDFWNVLTDYLPRLKDVVLAREGKLVIRPDTGNPADIICGDPAADPDSPEGKGAIKLLYQTFGGRINAKGYIELDPHIGLIYGDSITPWVAADVFARLATMGFASTNVVFGMGSYLYQCVTRDSYGMASKSTYGEVGGVGKDIFKDPKTDKGSLKKSAVGLIAVQLDSAGNMVLKDRQAELHPTSCLLEKVYSNGILLRTHTLSEIRSRLHPVL